MSNTEYSVFSIFENFSYPFRTNFKKAGLTSFSCFAGWWFSFSQLFCYSFVCIEDNLYFHNLVFFPLLFFLLPSVIFLLSKCAVIMPALIYFRRQSKTHFRFFHKFVAPPFEGALKSYNFHFHTTPSPQIFTGSSSTTSLPSKIIELIPASKVAKIYATFFHCFFCSFSVLKVFPN